MFQRTLSAHIEGLNIQKSSQLFFAAAKNSSANLHLKKSREKQYSHIAECERQSVNGCVYLAKYSFCAFWVHFLEVNACGRR